MPDLRELETQGQRRDGAARVFDLRTRQEIHVLPTEPFMQQTPTSDRGSDPGPHGLARPIDDQVRTIEELAARHYPGEDEHEQRTAFVVEQLKQRLREFQAKFMALNVKEMR